MRVDSSMDISSLNKPGSFYTEPKITIKVKS